MVGWNIAATQLVADRVHHKISDFVHFTSAILISVNEIDEHVKCTHACMNAVGFPLSMMFKLHLCMINNLVCLLQFNIQA